MVDSSIGYRVAHLDFHRQFSQFAQGKTPDDHRIAPEIFEYYLELTRELRGDRTFQFSPSVMGFRGEIQQNGDLLNKALGPLSLS